MSEVVTTPRPKMLLSATALVVAAGTMTFGGMLAIYANMRHDSGGVTATWLPEGVSIANGPLGYTTIVTLVLSLFSVQWAVSANRDNDRNNALAALGLTTMFGLAHITMVVFAVKEIGVGVSDSTWAALTYPITAASLITTGIAILYLLAGAVKLLAGQVGKQNPTVSASALFWYFQMAAWFSIFITIYAIK